MRGRRSIDDDEGRASAVKGSLTVVGTGIQPVAHTSAQAVASIEHAGKVFFLSADVLTEYWIRQLNPACESLNSLYDTGKDRHATYEQIVECVLGAVGAGVDVCLVLYGHPGVFADPAHEAIRRAREEGYSAEMLPAISADGCMFADLGIDPGTSGCQSYEATDFLINRRRFDPRSALVLWQIGVIGERSHKKEAKVWNRDAVRILTDVLLEHYPRDHTVTVYEAARYACLRPSILTVELQDLPDAPMSAIATLYVPPLEQTDYDPDMLKRLTATAG